MRYEEIKGILESLLYDILSILAIEEIGWNCVSENCSFVINIFVVIGKKFRFTIVININVVNIVGLIDDFINDLSLELESILINQDDSQYLIKELSCKNYIVVCVSWNISQEFEADIWT